MTPFVKTVVYGQTLFKGSEAGNKPFGALKWHFRGQNQTFKQSGCPGRYVTERLRILLDIRLPSLYL